jgi:hypothetical protein
VSAPAANVRPRQRRPARRDPAASPGEAREAAFALLVINQKPLQRTAWAEYHTAQKRHEKAARDLHRHEEIDTPAYEQWLNQTFPVLLTELRQLEDEVATKTRQIRFVRAMSAHTGRSARRLWAELKEAQANPRGPEDGEPTSDDERKSGRHRPDDDDFFDRDEPPPYRGRGQSSAHRATPSAVRNNSPVARDIYRRLVSKLHPDRGGEFTPARQRLWHEVQQAWAGGDADWLARLEVELDSSADLGLLGLVSADPLTINSPISRLRRAIAELKAARRDLDRKLREYRSTPAWRFSLAKKRTVLERRTLTRLQKETQFLLRQLAHLNKTIQLWDEPPLGRTRPRYGT